MAADPRVAAAIAARKRAESGETATSPDRWIEADAYAALSADGWSVRRIAEACETNKDSVAIMCRMVSTYVDADSRPINFWPAYQEAKSGAHVGQATGEFEWFTPPAYIVAATQVMGGIDLDPASCATANEVVGATAYYTAADDGLKQPWAGRVWMNPPYSQPLLARFGEKLSAEFEAGNVTQACVLVNNATETAWWQSLAGAAAAVCFPAGRVRYWHPERQSSPLQGQAVLYFGAELEAFRAEFGQIGLVLAQVPARVAALEVAA